ncbi:hypothetical protein B0T11DRAFT_143288 [Plectosphaerella cucumerina]|uniref:Uncharacterized protein n=1 Tax=Plectosphaerella cucumerina TaxID=40658 RepID=A0A8K0T4P9_9PEZI|nr:hypothetical protein B0T11DRAFT_143288 [Plectosphaerella cucumerina]
MAFQEQSPTIIPALPTPTVSSGSLPSFSVTCSTTIAAPPLLCLSTVLDTSSWPSWNTFCPSATIDSTPSPESVSLNAPELEALARRPAHLFPGVAATFSVHMTPNASSPTYSAEHVTLLERFSDPAGRTGYRVSWKFTSYPHLLLHAERVQEFVEATGPDGGVITEYRNYETFGGLLTPVMRFLKSGELLDGFNRWMTSLKSAAEKAAKKTETPQ